ncbi:ABC transporter substrate-binding protein [Martelella soudanensis]|uniref:ABC transporter substrate-binding protein n=1 Tax=unclassified Martelella TaxID=2629616 RepID=UPI0015DE110A|nr:MULTISPECIES: ABC transporter substrate-binding protein [unclassified Martelella]
MTFTLPECRTRPIPLIGAAAIIAILGASLPTQSIAETLTIAASSAPTTLDPTLSANGLPSVWYPNLAYASLIRRAPDGTAQPGLALDWAYSEDRLSFVMNLREGVKFSDGTDLTAEGVVEWLERYKEKGQFTAWLANVSKIEASGPFQVTLTLSTLDPMLPYGLDQGGMAGAVVSPGGLADPDKLGTATFGAGPYMIDSERTIIESQYVYVKNPHYWNPDAQYWDEVVIKVIPDGNAVLSSLRTGQVQVAEGQATDAEAAEAAGLKIFSAPSAMVGVYLGDIGGNIVPALADVRVRQALNFAIDRAGIAAALYGEYGAPTTQFVPDGIGGYVAELERFYSYDAEKAKALLAEAGYPDGFSFDLLLQPAVPGGDLLGQAMAANWQAVGVDVTLKPSEGFSTYVPMYFSGDYPATTLTFQYSVQLTDTQQLVTSDAVYNFSKFVDEKADSLAVEQRKYDIDTPEGVAAAEASERYMVENAFLVPVASVDALIFASDDVTGLDFTTYPWPDPSNWKPVE